MNIDKLTQIPVAKVGHLNDVTKPVLPYWNEVKDAMCSEPHSHPRGQLVYSIKGVTRVITNEGIHLIPSSQAFWCPPHHQHTLMFPGAVEVANLFIDEKWAKELPNTQQVLNVSLLMKGLIGKALEIEHDYQEGTTEHRLMVVIIDQLKELSPAPLTLPWSNNKKLETIMKALIADPANTESIDHWAEQVHCTPRTLARLFNKEVNMTFTQWRMQAKFFHAIEQLNQKHSVTAIALDLGYSSPSAFISAFRKTLGKTPTEYVEALF
ncbi:helix-turn-helix domain-containing protein [Litoribrevibacter albus]|uniref:AraC family transcriptional regulator n=1 Tax=Litoribrevibacter albus TaxID=1473156 RepID=A0AA37SB66_9GAMM|nr:helix-turn-helix transcriptional regulator [Litoribrevibacter albus]GLQ31981.1 AraC family transcriptional regulator [Litoribrevibacter albus]